MFQEELRQIFYFLLLLQNILFSLLFVLMYLFYLLFISIILFIYLLKSGLEHDDENFFTNCLFKICFIHQIILILLISMFRKTTRFFKPVMAVWILICNGLSTHASSINPASEPSKS